MMIQPHVADKRGRLSAPGNGSPHGKLHKIPVGDSVAALPVRARLPQMSAASGIARRSCRRLLLRRWGPRAPKHFHAAATSQAAERVNAVWPGPSGRRDDRRKRRIIVGISDAKGTKSPASAIRRALFPARENALHAAAVAMGAPRIIDVGLAMLRRSRPCGQCQYRDCQLFHNVSP